MCSLQTWPGLTILYIRRAQLQQTKIHYYAVDAMIHRKTHSFRHFDLLQLHRLQDSPSPVCSALRLIKQQVRTRYKKTLILKKMNKNTSSSLDCPD